VPYSVLVDEKELSKKDYSKFKGKHVLLEATK